jgi:uncharacterized protein
MTSVSHDPETHRFEASVDGRGGFLSYRVHARVMTLLHTEVDPALEGRGVAAELVRAALAHARAHDMKVDPQCGYAASYMQRHPETMSLHA